MLHEGIGAGAARERALRMLEEVNLADPAGVFGRYPHQLSGGQQQRIVIAMALIAAPALLVMDEPTTGLDVTVEAAVLDLVRALRQRHNSAILYISHNLGTVARVCDRVGVMYGGELVEEGSLRHVFANPRHPYTRGLLDCLPTLGRDKRGAPLTPIPGQVGSPRERPIGCGFGGRCVHADPGRCLAAPIALSDVPGDARHRVRCVRAGELAPWARREAVAGAPDGATARPATLVVDRLRKVYRPRKGWLGIRRGSVRALDEVDLQATKARTLAIVGESGSGKSTLARVLSGLETATGGQVHLGDTEVGRHLDRPALGRAPPKAPDGLPEPRQHAQPEPHGGLLDRPRPPPAAPPLARGHPAGGRPPPRGRQAAGGAGRAEAPPAVGGPEAARRHRPGAGRRPGCDGRRRARLRARRLGAGVDRQPPERAPGQPRIHARVHLPRPRRGALSRRPRRGDVPRQGRRVRPGRGRVLPALPPLHRGAPVRRAGAGPGRPAPAHPAGGRPPERRRRCSAAAPSARAARAAWGRSATRPRRPSSTSPTGTGSPATSPLEELTRLHHAGLPVPP